ncbi:hypothetical protein [Caulobacter rhizosphaerae]|jgi:hypothetical protein|uniref:hypothetical protein n=1 Tax=Caulobacter rhizosphaerae TaxID=2010972 RepID=UPI0013D14D59|nr:hypothetical protein [Caulobacter rhizosphaerae]GGL33301.1 hypothetical protein GCM10010983_33010 [Caulobacter rhizosphaerae]
MKASLAALALLSLANPAFAQEWPRQDWLVFSAPTTLGDTSYGAMRSGGFTVQMPWDLGPPPLPSRVARGGRVKVALDINSIDRVGDEIQIRYFVWSDRSGYAEVTSRINCARTGEVVVSSRDYDGDWVPVRVRVENQRRITPISMAVATRACHPSQRGRVSGKSLPEVVQGAS